MFERSTVPCRVDFRPLSAQSPKEQTGSLESIWITGCTILGSSDPVLEPVLELCIYLSDGEWPLSVDRAHITSGHWDSFTVEFVSLSVKDRQRLQGYLATEAALTKA